jgi:hypothetical protein
MEAAAEASSAFDAPNSRIRFSSATPIFRCSASVHKVDEEGISSQRIMEDVKLVDGETMS